MQPRNPAAGLLFRVEKLIKLGETKKSTGKPYESNVPREKNPSVRPVTAQDVVWSKGRYDRKAKVT